MNLPREHSDFIEEVKAVTGEARFANSDSKDEARFNAASSTLSKYHYQRRRASAMANYAARSHTIDQDGEDIPPVLATGTATVIKKVEIVEDPEPARRKATSAGRHM